MTRSAIETLEMFAAHAPTEIPAWFQVKTNSAPTLLYAHDALKTALAGNTLPPVREEDALAWLGDQSYDPPSEDETICQAAKALLDKNTQDRHDFLVYKERTRYFAWRWFYAEQMVLMSAKQVEAMER